jgi:hypothetical protein
MAGYDNEDMDTYDRDEGYDDQPYPQQQAGGDNLPLDQGQGLACHPVSPYSNEAQGVGRLPEPNDFSGSTNSNALYGNRNPSQSYGTEGFQQTAAYFECVDGRYYTRPHGVRSRTLGLNSADGDHDRGWYQDGSSSTTSNEALGYQPTPFQTHTSSRGLSPYTDAGAYPPKYHLPTDSGFRFGSDSLASNGTTAHTATRATPDIQSWMYPGEALADLSALSPKTRHLNMYSEHAAPWSPPQPFDADQVPQSPHENESTGWHEPSDTTHSFSRGNLVSSCVTQTPTTPLTSMDFPNHRMEDSWMTEGANRSQILNAAYQTQSLASHYTEPTDPIISPVRFNFVRSATPQMIAKPALDRCYLALPTAKKPSSTNSYSTDASSPGPPPTDDPDTLYCDEAECVAFYTGIYRRGNLGRHRRQRHQSGTPYVCEDDTCAKEFKRQDARVKHYRKYHPELASPYVPRPSQSRRPRGDPDIDLRNISSWT